MTSPSTTAGTGWPAGTPTLPFTDLDCRMVSGGRLLLTVELPNTTENWAAAHQLGLTGALALPTASASDGAATGASSMRSKETLVGGDTPLANKLAGTTGKASTKAAPRSGSASSNSRSTRTRGAAATKADAGAATEQRALEHHTV